MCEIFSRCPPLYAKGSLQLSSFFTPRSSLSFLLSEIGEQKAKGGSFIISPKPAEQGKGSSFISPQKKLDSKSGSLPSFPFSVSFFLSTHFPLLNYQTSLIVKLVAGTTSKTPEKDIIGVFVQVEGEAQRDGCIQVNCVATLAHLRSLISAQLDDFEFEYKFLNKSG
jgi:hypothetical protein